MLLKIQNFFRTKLINLVLVLLIELNSITKLKNKLKAQIVNMKEVAIKRFQEKNERLRVRCSKLEDRIVAFESSSSNLEQYGRKNNSYKWNILKCQR